MTARAVATPVRAKRGTQAESSIKSALARAVSLDPNAKGSAEEFFVLVFTMSPSERVEITKRGLPATFVSRIAKATGAPKARMISLLGLSRATVDRKAHAKQSLSVVESERVLGLARLVGQVQAMINESGDPAGFDAARWVAGWLERPVPALGGRRPGEFMDTAEGQQLVSDLLARARSGAFA